MVGTLEKLLSNFELTLDSDFVRWEGFLLTLDFGQGSKI